jgi:hypothetical protein
MEAAIPDAHVESYGALIPELVLLDPDDRHVLAATLHAGAALLTFCGISRAHRCRERQCSIRTRPWFP